MRLWGRNPVDPDAKADYFDSLHHSAAVVGLNTSAFLEGAIAGKPVFTTLLPEHYENQEGTIHFHYLLNVGGGLLHTAKTLDEQCRQLNACASGHRTDVTQEPPVCRSVHPASQGRTWPLHLCSPTRWKRFAACRGSPAASSRPHRVLRGVMAPVVSLASRRVAEPLMLSEHERAIVARQRAHRERVDAAWRVKDAHNLSEQQQRDARVAERAALQGGTGRRMAAHEDDEKIQATADETDRSHLMKILFLARHFSYLRLFESAIAELAERGHTIHLSADREESLGGAGLVERLAARYPKVTVGWTPTRQSGAWLDSRAEAAPRYRLPPVPRSSVRHDASATGSVGGADPAPGPIARRTACTPDPGRPSRARHGCCDSSSRRCPGVGNSRRSTRSRSQTSC